MLKLGVQQAEDIAKGVGPARDVQPPVRGPRPVVAQTGRPGPAPLSRARPEAPPPPGSAGRAVSRGLGAPALPDPIGPQRPGQLPAGGKSQSPSPETEPVTSEQRRRALWLHLAFTQRVSPWPGQDFPSPQDARRGPGLSCREPTACYPGGRPWDQAWSVRSAGAQAKGFKRERGCLLLPRPRRWGRGGCLARPLQLCAPTAAGAAPHRSPRPGAGGGLQRRRKSSQLPLPRPASVTVDLWGNAGPTWASVCSQMSRLRAQPSERRPATVTQRAAPGRAPPTRLGAFLRTFKGTPVPVEASFFPPPGRASSVNLQDPKATR
ncbi:translation initiation factor IF-2-like [Panthera uncia]|uniref:translation initiation factor IF-2-like n=1 Tax=Panthera uncia TaxID=29064 RepID=UPI0020FFA9DA|nr:translation initiation factor IF-2-like [Panthera uncia]